MTQSALTVVVPFDSLKIGDVNSAIEALQNPAEQELKKSLDAAGLVHFMSIVAVEPAAAYVVQRRFAAAVLKTMRIMLGRRDNTGRAHLVIEANVDGDPGAALRMLARTDVMGGNLVTLLNKAGQSVNEGNVAAVLEQHRLEVGLGWFENRKPTGLWFAGTPGMTVKRIKAERVLADEIREQLRGMSGARTALAMLQQVRNVVFEKVDRKWAFVSEPVPLLEDAKPLLAAWWPITKAAFLDFLWPLTIPPVLFFLYSWYVRSNPLDVALWHFLLTLLITLLAAGGVVVSWYGKLRREEDADAPVDKEPGAHPMAEILLREDHKGIVQNHLAGVSIIKPGLVRHVALRLALWLTGNIGTRRSRPGHIDKIGSIHFARWLHLPGTDLLVFLSNYDGSWQSYLEDFIARIRAGLSTVWSNTRDFPKTAGLWRGGAEDAARFKRWARRQQTPTRFWYSAYLDLTTHRIRVNAEIRHGFASALTESEAARWLALFGYPLPETLDTEDIPTLVFGGLGSLRYACCLLVKLEDRESAREWLEQIRDEISYGAHPSAEMAADAIDDKGVAARRNRALVAGFSRSGLELLIDEKHLPRALRTFPVAFQQGMAARSRVLGDEGIDAPSKWDWGFGDASVDAVLLFYAETSEALCDDLEKQKVNLKKAGHRIVHEITLTKLDEKPSATEPYKVFEPFGFRDGISQPRMRGTQRSLREDEAIHVVEPGELVLGYRDGSGHAPPLPHCDGRAIGRNGTYLVVRQLEQHVNKFKQYAQDTAKALSSDPRRPPLEYSEFEEWIAAKMVGRWKNGTSLVRYPDRPGTKSGKDVDPDNAFLFGREDPDGLRCPLGAHIRRANPRESFEAGSDLQLKITNRHRILRVGRSYESAKGGDPGLLFMCVNADIERQFEFLQQTWLLGPNFGGLRNEIDPVVGGTGDTMTIPTASGPLQLPALKKFVSVRGGAYFFMPGKSALRALLD